MDSTIDKIWSEFKSIFEILWKSAKFLRTEILYWVYSMFSYQYSLTKQSRLPAKQPMKKTNFQGKSTRPTKLWRKLKKLLSKQRMQRCFSFQSKFIEPNFKTVKKCEWLKICDWNFRQFSQVKTKCLSSRNISVVCGIFEFFYERKLSKTRLIRI